ncbi:hypothetical protein CVD28_07415 [Bacillus sp. M6-12]|nr:hypothetical protein CVD28_07415 [Bacillus sp. M6-12]
MEAFPSYGVFSRIVYPGDREKRTNGDPAGVNVRGESECPLLQSKCKVNRSKKYSKPTPAMEKGLLYKINFFALGFSFDKDLSN